MMGASALASDREFRDASSRYEDAARRVAGAAAQVCAVTRLHEWPLSVVQRIRLAGGDSFVLKTARGPMQSEGRNLLAAAASGLPVPHMLHYELERLSGIMTLCMEDLGESVRNPTTSDAVASAARVHETGLMPNGPWVDTDWLVAELEAARSVATTIGQSYQEFEPVAAAVATEARAAVGIRGLESAPFGVVHSEFHPSSMIVRNDEIFLLDWARTFIGPQLLDLASFFGTTTLPERKRARNLISNYLETRHLAAAGRDRDGMPVEAWALYVHRLWVVLWYIQSLGEWVDVTDHRWRTKYAAGILKHLTECKLLRGESF